MDILNYLIEANAESILADDCFYKYFYKVTKENVNSFKDALSSKDTEERNLKYYEASHIH